jgi:hypothetical protein
MKPKSSYLCLSIAIFLSACSDPEGLSKVETAFKPGEQSHHGARAAELVKAARDGDYFTAVAGFQWLRGEQGLTLEQITALQDAIGKIQSQLADRAAKGDPQAQKQMRALQGETDRE